MIKSAQFANTPWEWSQFRSEAAVSLSTQVRKLTLGFISSHILLLCNLCRMIGGNSFTRFSATGLLSNVLRTNKLLHTLLQAQLNRPYCSGLLPMIFSTAARRQSMHCILKLIFPDSSQLCRWQALAAPTPMSTSLCVQHVSLLDTSTFTSFITLSADCTTLPVNDII